MAISHIASIRGSSRMSNQQRVSDSGRNDQSMADVGDNQKTLAGQDMNQTQQLSTLSINDDGFLSPSLDALSESCLLNQTRSRSSVPSPPPPSLEVLNSLSDIEAHYQNDLHQMNTLKSLEEKWLKITRNFEKLVKHLDESSHQVTEASVNCLESFFENVEATCDKVDTQLKAMYHLMTKCDELTTKLSIATSFRDEIKTLRKSVETLEQLHKTGYQLEHRTRTPAS